MKRLILATATIMCMSSAFALQHVEPSIENYSDFAREACESAALKAIEFKEKGRSIEDIDATSDVAYKTMMAMINSDSDYLSDKDTIVLIGLLAGKVTKTVWSDKTYSVETYGSGCAVATELYLEEERMGEFKD